MDPAIGAMNAAVMASEAASGMQGGHSIGIVVGIAIVFGPSALLFIILGAMLWWGKYHG
jgi:hypothetical protein